MADDSTNEDSWLYGDSNPDQSENSQSNGQKVVESEECGVELPNANNVELPAQHIEEPQEACAEKSEEPVVKNESAEAATNGSSEAPTEDRADEEGDVAVPGGEVPEEGEEDDDDDDDSDDDDVQVTIGDIKTSTTYTSINLKRGLNQDKNKQPGKFSIEEFEAVGTINGVAAHEFNLDSLEDKPWRKPGADITDYFNYGFNEDTWRAYCERQKKIRIHDSGVGLMSLGGTSKIYSMAGPPPGRKLAGTIDVIGGNPSSSRRSLENKPAAADAPTTPTVVGESPIQVMTADRREYGRGNKASFPDLSVPPPTLPPFDMPPPAIDTIPTYTSSTYTATEFYPPEADPYYQSYEPTQDSQWGAQPWEGGGTAPVGVATNVVIPLGGDSSSSDRRKGRSSSASDNKEEPDKERERHRESRHRHRSRSRSAERSSRSSTSKKRNKSRSRSPHRHRSKKKSRRERDDSE